MANFNQRLVEYNRDIRDEKGRWRLTRCSHVRGPRALDLLDVFVRLLGEQLVKIGYDLVQQSETLDTLVVRLQFHVELGKVRYRGEHYANEVALFVVQLLEKVLISWKNETTSNYIFEIFSGWKKKFFERNFWKEITWTIEDCLNKLNRLDNLSFAMRRKEFE